MKIECKECNGFFNGKEVIIQNEMIKIKEKDFTLYYYLCPLCGKKYQVMIDNEETILLSKELESIKEKLVKAKKHNKFPKEKQIEKFYKIRKRLKSKRDVLNNRYNMSFYQIGDVKEQLELSLPKEVSEKE